MSDVLAPWRATYAPGDWIVLAGPTSLVVIQPLAAEWSDLVATLWQEVLACSSITQLADQLAAFGIADMPSFGAFFWNAEGMRSLVRGGVVVREAATGERVADGNGVQTWSEVGLGGIEQIRIELPRAPAGLMELPLVVGAAFASSLTLDASHGAEVRSPQQPAGWPQVVARSDEADVAAAVPGPHGSLVPDLVVGSGAPPVSDAAPEAASHAGLGPASDADPDPDTEDYPDTENYPSTEDYPDTENYPDTEDLAPPEDFGDAARALMENASTELMPAQLPDGPDGTPAYGDADPATRALASLTLSDGQRLDLVGVVRIGRAPSADPGDGFDAQLVTVSSPQQDISRTHLQVHPDGDQIVVTDLDSTNGTMLVLPGTGTFAQRLPAGQAVAVPLGSVLELGDGVSVSIDLPH
jgi:hypothetical protein